MRPEIIATTAILFAIGLAASTNATASTRVAQLWGNKQCQKCNLLVADADDAQQQRQQRQQQRQERLQQLPPEIRQQIQEQQQQRQEVRQERQEQRQEVRQERRDNRIEQWQQLPPDVRQEHIEQWQQIPPDVRQERRDERQDARRQERQDERKDARQERRDDRQDARQDRRDDWLQDAWLPQDPWYYTLDSTTYTAPVQTYVNPAPGVNSIKVEMRSLSQEQATVVIENADARQELIFTRNRTQKTVYLAPGRYKLWFKNAQGSSWISGTLNLGNSDRIRIAFNEDKELVQISDDPQAWTEDRRVSRQTQVR